MQTLVQDKFIASGVYLLRQDAKWPEIRHYDVVKKCIKHDAVKQYTKHDAVKQYTKHEVVKQYTKHDAVKQHKNIII